MKQNACFSKTICNVLKGEIKELVENNRLNTSLRSMIKMDMACGDLRGGKIINGDVNDFHILLLCPKLILGFSRAFTGLLFDTSI